MKLRPYQEQIIAEARTLMGGGKRSFVIVAPTGSGKTVLTGNMINMSRLKGVPSWFIVHRRELIEQSSETFSRFGVPHGIVAPGYKMDPTHLVQICSIGSLPRRMDLLQQPKLVLWDECHHTAAASWKKVRLALTSAFHIGLTATPQRLDGKGLGDYFEHIILGPSVTDLIEGGHLSKYKLYEPPGATLQNVRVRAGEFDSVQVAEEMGRSVVVGSLVREYNEKCRGMRAICFESSIELSIQMAAMFNGLGIPAEHVDGGTSRAERAASIARYREGKTLVLFNVDLFGEGFDVPATQAVVDRNPTWSLAKWLQRCGRALRPAENKPFAIILDHGGNRARHGFPDEDRFWHLGGQEKKKGGHKTKTCDKCYFVADQEPPAKKLDACPECGTPYPKSEYIPRNLEHVEGDLVEANLEAARQYEKPTPVQARTLSSLITIAKQRGYKHPQGWARHVFMAQQVKKLTKGREK